MFLNLRKIYLQLLNIYCFFVETNKVMTEICFNMFKVSAIISYVCNSYSFRQVLTPSYMLKSRINV